MRKKSAGIRHFWLFAAITVLSVTFCGCNGDDGVGGNGKALPPGQAELEREIFARINKIRQSKGLIQLIRDPELDKVAHGQSGYLYEIGKLTHHDAGGGEIDARFDRAGIDYVLAGENVARNRGFADPAEEAVRGWMNSRGHRENILHEKFRETGISVVYCEKTRYYYFTQVFLKP